MPNDHRRLYDDAVSAMTTLISRPSAPTTADVARHLGTSEAEVLGLFATDRELLQATLENAMVLLHDQCVKGVVKADPKDPLAQFIALSDAYIEWAYEHPREFVILGSLPADGAWAEGNLSHYERALHELMGRMLALAQAKGLIRPDEDLDLMIATSRSFAFGVANKMLSGNMARWLGGDSALESARKALHLFTHKMMTPGS